MTVMGSLIGVVILTRLLDPSSYGELALGMTVAGLFNYTVYSPLQSGATRLYTQAREEADLGSYWTALRKLTIASTGVIIVLVVVALFCLSIAGRPGWLFITAIISAYAILSGYNTILNGIHNAARHRSITALHQSLESWLRVLLASGLLLWLGATSTVAAIGYALAALLLLGSQYMFFNVIIRNRVSQVDEVKKWQSKLWTYSWPFATWGICSWAQLASDRWALGLFLTTNEIGLYTALFQLGYYPMLVAMGSLIEFIAPILFQRADNAKDRLRRVTATKIAMQITYLSLSMTVLIFTIALTLHAQIFNLILTKEYASISFLLPWILLASGIFATSQTIALRFMIQIDTKILIMPKVITSLLGLGLNFLGAYSYGIAGVVAAQVIFSLMYFTWMISLSQKLVSHPNMKVS
jgi:O-antigen/teichoic acid export membrane protein